MLPQLRALERQFASAVVVVGVHSGKYIAERDTRRIRDASIRLDNLHPTVNDRQYRIWRGYAVRAWPTLVAIGPDARVLGTHAGEFTAGMIAPFLERMIAAYGEQIDRTPRAFPAGRPSMEPGTLRFPSKVALDGRRLAVADTGHHRVLVGTLDDRGRRLRVERVLGRGVPGFQDGPDGALDGPQGVLVHGDTVYIADAGNHAVRAADLATGTLTTLAGTGRQLRTRADLEAGALSSPWDLARIGEILYIAMAGNHRLYALDLASRALRVHSGSGAEEIHDGPQAEAALAQPMGIVADATHPDGARLYFADAESSAVRWADADAGGRVGTVVGTGLFDFGDADGTGDEVRMQHPQALALAPDGRLLVGDSYNDALKRVDPRTRHATTWLRGFHEPSGLAVAAGRVYVADTNAHRIAVVDVAGDTVDTGDTLEIVERA